MAADLDRYSDGPCLVAGAGRVEKLTPGVSGFSFEVRAALDMAVALRFRVPRAPACIMAQYKGENRKLSWVYDAPSRTVLIRLDGEPDGVMVRLEYIRDA